MGRTPAVPGPWGVLPACGVAGPGPTACWWWPGAGAVSSGHLVAGPVVSCLRLPVADVGVVLSDRSVVCLCAVRLPVAVGERAAGSQPVLASAWSGGVGGTRSRGAGVRPGPRPDQGAVVAGCRRAGCRWYVPARQPGSLVGRTWGTGACRLLCRVRARRARDAVGGAGAGLGAALSYGVFLVLNVIVVLSIKQFARYHVLRRLPKPVLHDWWELLKICIPIGLTVFCEQSIFGAVGLLMTAYGTTVLAAHQAAMNFTTIVYMLPLSVSMAITILVGFEVGGGRENGARAYIRLSRVLTLVFVGAIALVLAAMRDTVAALYTTNAEVQELLRVFLLYALIMQFCDCVNAPLQGALRGYKDVTVTFWLAVLSFWGIGLPSGYVLAGWTALGPYGYWVGLNGGIIVGAVLLMIRLRIIEQRMRRTAYSIS